MYMVVHSGQKGPIFRGPGSSLRTRPGGPAAGDPCATSSSAAIWLATRRARTAAYYPAPLGTRDVLNNAPMMRCSTSQTLAWVCDALQRNGWCQSVQRSADAAEQLKHTSVAPYHLPQRSITGGSRIVTAPGEDGGLAGMRS